MDWTDPNANLKQFDALPIAEENMVDIVIVKYNNPDVEAKCLEHIRKHTAMPYKLTIIDNYPTNLSLSERWNEAIAKSECDYVCLLNTDAFVTPFWLTQMLGAFRDPECVAVGCSGDNVGGVQRKINTPELAKQRQNVFKELNQLSGFCMVIRRDNGIEFPREVPFYGGEHAWCLLQRKAGKKLYWAQGSFVYHLGQDTAKKAGTAENMRIEGQNQYVHWLAGITPVMFPVYNRLEYTKQSLQALLASRCGQVTVIDDGSTDGTREWLEEFMAPIPESRARLIVNDSNRGIAANMNSFFSDTTRDEFVAKVDNDTIVPHDWLTELLRVAIWCHLDVVQAKHHITSNKYKTWDEWVAQLTHKQDEFNTVNAYLSPFVGGSGVAIRREKMGQLREMDWKLGGWTQWQNDRDDVVCAFTDQTEIELLDMEGDNKPKHKEYREYYRDVGRVNNRVAGAVETVGTVMHKLGTRFAYTRWGDGEIYMVNGHAGYEHTQYNSKELAEEMSDAFSVADDAYMIAVSGGMPHERHARHGLFAPFEYTNELKQIVGKYHDEHYFFSPIAFHYLYTFYPDTAWQLFTDQLKHYTVGFVGGDHLNRQELWDAFHLVDFVETPSVQAYDTIESWYPNVVKMAKKCDVVLLACAMTANVVQYRLWKKRIKVGTIDIGSVANGIVGNNMANHTWLNLKNDLSPL